MPGLGAVVIAFSSGTSKISLSLGPTHKNICNSFLVYLKVVDPALLGEGFALEEPGCLVIGVLLKHIRAYVDTLLPLLPVESGSRKKKGVHYFK